MANITDGARTEHAPFLLASLLHFDSGGMVWALLGEGDVFIAPDLPLSSGQKGSLVAVPILSTAFFRFSPSSSLTNRGGGSGYEDDTSGIRSPTPKEEAFP